jgi:pyruvate formate lyase activating enzyme
VRTVTAGELLAEIEKDLLFFDQSGGGVTFSGGEPLVQHLFLTAILDRCRERLIHTAVDTGGFAPESVMESVARRTDLVLFDIKLADDADHVRYTGVPAEPVFRNLALLGTLPCKVRLRFPVIPGVTDTPENLHGLIDRVTSATIFRDIHLLAFHRAGEGKYRRLGRENPMVGTVPPGPGRMEELKSFFESHGFSVSIGG